MKIARSLVLFLIAAVISVTAFATQPLAGPRGGRIVTTAAPHVEFFVTPDRTVVVSLYDAELKPLAPGSQVVTAVAEAKSGKSLLAFNAKDGVFVSSLPLPEGDGYRVVLQVRDDAQAKPKNYRLEFHDGVCDGCKRAEYACVCEESGDNHGH